jgi:predicted DNA-binding transcriptional regulator AlpA
MSKTETTAGERLITIGEFMALLGVRGRSTFLLYERKWRDQGFPRRIALSPSQPRFRLSEALAFVERLQAAA